MPGESPAQGTRPASPKVQLRPSGFAGIPPESKGRRRIPAEAGMRVPRRKMCLVRQGQQDRTRLWYFRIGAARSINIVKNIFLGENFPGLI